MNNGDIVNIPAGYIITPSANVLYDKDGNPISFKDIDNTYSYGGSRVFVLDDDLIGLLGRDDSSNKAVGNMLQGVGKSIWFVGNGVTDGVRVFDLSSLLSIGGTSQSETVTVTAGASADGSPVIRVTGANITGSPIDVTASVSLGDTASEVADSIRDAIRLLTAITDQYYISTDGADIIFTDKAYRANDATLSIDLQDGDSTGITLGASTNTSSGSIKTSATLSSTPQFCKWNGSNWDNAVQIGLPEIDDTLELTLTTSSTKSSGFDGLVKGSRTARVARKRYGSISIASPPTALITASEQGDTVVITIPPLDIDGSKKSDNTWLVYLTYEGQGSTNNHFLFPIEILEEELDGSVAPTTHTMGTAKYRVISQDTTVTGNRLVELEFSDADLLLLQPFDDYYSLDPCKFLAKLGNVMCGIGTGDDGTGFDVSFPNNHEAFPPDWRDWFSEVPVSIAQEPDFGFFWVCTANNVYIASWTGVTTGSAPVVIEKRSSLYGAIGEGACVSIHGILYVLSKGGTLVRISPDGTIDYRFSIRARGILSTFTSTTQMGWDEATNSLVIISGRNAITYQIDTDKWSAPITIDDTCLAVTQFNGNLYVSAYITSEFNLFKWHNGGDSDWNMTMSFQNGRYGLSLKDIIKVETVLSHEQADTLTFSACKNFSTSSLYSLGSESLASSGNLITVRRYWESSDYDNIAISVSGVAGGTTIHNVFIELDVHSIERVT